MLANKQSLRSLVSFLVTWSFVVLTVTGLVLYIVPQGRVAYWIHWSLAGMEKEQWGWVHMMFGGVFIVSGVLHLYFNWKPFKAFLAARVSGHLRPKREVFIATALTVAIFAVSAADLPPASWIIDLNERIKASWVTSPELEPPFGHAETVSLAGLSRRMQFDLEHALAALRAAGLTLDGPSDTLETIARRNATTPMAVYAVIQRQQPRPVVITPTTRAALEDQLAGTGLGRKTLAQVCETVGVDTQVALGRLAAAGIDGAPDATVKSVGEGHDLLPIDVVALMLGIE
jgi:hypothetical protein